MASALNPAQSLQDEATCSICLDYFLEPVMIIDCGHNFCRSCIIQCWEGSENRASCPQCRKPFSWRNLRPNRQMGNIVELAKQFSLQVSREARPGEGVCERHKEPLKLFCEDDEAPICLVCDRSKAHKAHCVVSLEDAAQEYQEEILCCLKVLKEEQGKILSADKPNQELLKQVEAERQKLVAEFQQLRQFLDDQERLLLARLDQMQKEIEKLKDENAKKFSGELSDLGDLIGELEEKQKQPPSVFLQDIRKTLSRCKKGSVEPPATVNSPELQSWLEKFSQESLSFQETARKFRETLSKPKWVKENVILDPDTAHPRFSLSADGKGVRWGDIRRDLPYNPKRFTLPRCVLGSRGFSSGMHYWIVEVAGEGSWAVGVARESVCRKEQIDFAPAMGIWAMAFSRGQYRALTAPATALFPSNPPEKIKVCLDYEGKTVAFYDANTDIRLVCFQSAEFWGQKIFPFFRVADLDTWLTLCH